ncbi:UDP-4-amino-4,6-dideoxy-N-acetyl-beta-L-altrosamine N-acetyltransferase [Shewanella vesiculosa]|jgi:UDP-4-amino-4,6-dideoxy-N-acetyl-beta-L-altrosamine N-acetyltransferase|uniref:UDP-4-amino-4, 6-dideoxy-N-acetyl-beta-L-altrosamine N-acetyltransferase n=1 Tax=Shewanella vesiculosa TaxID=518738 RepID=UPI000F50832B|nr:UDP-4-amino-4,6-dideoxy-N-acetyl-beta-L-altrosamine N-acetyltransferase [Shewanella vesiculosa]RPA50719.1 UDP-4-amino-4,6-dideoxy-N-acetyl-beta-L-altrosamine N-acetyltransferase [Shewanella vesiculosa]UJL44286.1 UDP-4-amino-4,6-dideoxy-N-acetyl-beta-L-altrosamine N-acetyltransferase [Shewanella vesiculosa]
MSDVKLLPLSSDYLDLVLEWRNMPEVRKNMYTSHVISKKEHYEWFERIKCDATKAYFIFELDGKPSGLIGFVDINHNNHSATWAFYSGNTATRGVGSLMEVTALNYAFDNLELHKLSCEVLEFNHSVIKFHKKFGFQIEGIFKKHHFADEQYWDVYRLAIFKTDWQRCRLELYKKKMPLSPGKSYRENITFSAEKVAIFSVVSGDKNQLHLNHQFAIEHGFDSSIVHGFLVGSVFSKVFGTTFPGDGCIYMSQSMTFINPVYPDDQLEAIFVILSKIGRKLVVETTIINVQTNKKIITGVAELLISKNLQLEYLND